MRRLELYVRKYGPEVGPKLYHALQSQAAHAGVSARLRRKIDVLSGRAPAGAPAAPEGGETLPLFPDLAGPVAPPEGEGPTVPAGETGPATGIETTPELRAVGA